MDGDSEFYDYVPTTNDPGATVYILTMVVCVGVVGLAVAYIHWFQKRRRRMNAMEALDDEVDDDLDATDNNDDVLVFDNPEEFFGKRMTSKVGRCRKGWKEISDSYDSTLNESSPIDFIDLTDVVEHVEMYIAMGETKIERRPAIVPPPRDIADSASLYVLMDEQKAPLKSIRLRSLVRWDRETKKLCKLALPYSITSLIPSLFTILTMALIGRLLGTRSLSAYLLVTYGLDLTSMFLGGILSSLSTLCSQAIGAEKYILAGQYVQIAVLFYWILFIPQIILWWNYYYDFMIWMEFDESSARLGESYLRVYLFDCLTSTVQTGLKDLLEVNGHEKYVAILSCLHEATSFAVKFLALFSDVTIPFYGKPNLQLIAIIDFFLNIAFFIFNAVFTSNKGWLEDYTPGLIGSFAFSNTAAVRMFVRTAVPLSCGYVLSYGEWEILFLMVVSLGPAEVAAWGITGNLWSALEELTYAWGDAAEVRVSHLLGAGEAYMARLSAYKALFWGAVISTIVSIIMLCTTSFIPAFITDDIVLQSMVYELLPMVAVCNITLALGTMSWQILGAQGRYSLSSSLTLVGSWFVTIPLASISCFVLRWDLKGVVAAVIVGYIMSGTAIYTVLRCTDWEHIAAKVIRRNEKSAAAVSGNNKDEGSTCGGSKVGSIDDNIDFCKSSSSKSAIGSRSMERANLPYTGKDMSKEAGMGPAATSNLVSVELVKIPTMALGRPLHTESTDRRSSNRESRLVYVEGDQPDSTKQEKFGIRKFFGKRQPNKP